MAAAGLVTALTGEPRKDVNLSDASASFAPSAALNKEVF
jgi:hypothetical protein